MKNDVKLTKYYANIILFKVDANVSTSVWCRYRFRPIYISFEFSDFSRLSLIFPKNTYFTRFPRFSRMVETLNKYTTKSCILSFL